MSLPPEPYLYACSDGTQAYVFELQRPDRQFQIDSATAGGWLWIWRAHTVAEPGRYLWVGNDSLVDILTLERLMQPPLPQATYVAPYFISPDRWYVFFKDDLYGYWQAQMVDQNGEVLKDFGSVVGSGLSPNLDWVFENRYLGTTDHPDNGPWVQRLDGGSPVHLVGCQSAMNWADTTWDLDGNHLLRITNAMPYQLGVFRCDVRTDEVEVLQQIELHAPIDRMAISSDLRRVAFTEMWGLDQSWLLAVDIEIGELVKLHNGGQYHGFHWTRDGKYLVVQVDDGSPEGEGPKKLISFPDGKVYPLRGHYPCWPIRPNPAPYSFADVGSEAPSP